NDIHWPSKLGTKGKTFDDLSSFTVIRTAIDVLNSLKLSLCEAIVAIDVTRTHELQKIRVRLEIARSRIVDETILDAILLVALRENRIPQHLHFRQALRDAVAVFVKCEIPCIFIFEEFLQHPDMTHVERLIIEDRCARDDRVEVIRISLCFHQS